LKTEATPNGIRTHFELFAALRDYSANLRESAC
jgi:hypothetical protein